MMTDYIQWKCLSLNWKHCHLIGKMIDSDVLCMTCSQLPLSPWNSTTTALAVNPPQSNETCGVLGSLGDDSDPQLSCTVNSDCNQATCTPTFSQAVLDTLNLKFTLMLLPCYQLDRGAVEITMFSNNKELVTGTYTESTIYSFNVKVSTAPFVTLTATVTTNITFNQNETAFELQVGWMETKSAGRFR